MRWSAAEVAAWLLLLSACAPQTSEAYIASSALPSHVDTTVRLRQSLRPRQGASSPALAMQSGDSPHEQLAHTRRLLSAGAIITAAAGLAPQQASADILDIVTGRTKRDDVLARLKVGKVYIPTLKCNDKAMPCYDKNSDFWYDFPGEDEFEGYTATPSGLEIKDLPVNPDLKDLVLNSPSPDFQEGTNTIEVFVAGYLITPRYRSATDADIADFYDPANKKSKYFDVRNRDPRMFQFGKITLSLGKSKLIKGFEEGVSTMRVGMRRSIIVPPELGYGEKGSDGGTAFLKPIPPNGKLLFQVELTKILRG